MTLQTMREIIVGGLALVPLTMIGFVALLFVLGIWNISDFDEMKV